MPDRREYPTEWERCRPSARARSAAVLDRRGPSVLGSIELKLESSIRDTLILDDERECEASPRGALIRGYDDGQITVRRRRESKVRSTFEPRSDPSRVRAHHHRHRVDGDVHSSPPRCFHPVQDHGGDRGDDRRDGSRTLGLSRGVGLVGGRRGFGRPAAPASSRAPRNPGLDDGSVRTDSRRSRLTTAAAPSGGPASASDPVLATLLPRVSRLQAAGSDGLRPHALSLGDPQTRHVPPWVLRDDASLSRQEETRR
jgi:hypothetical protein